MVSDRKYLLRAIKLSQIALKNGEQPFGCVIVKGSEIITEATNRTKIDNDLTQHAEMVAMRNAQKICSLNKLSNCTIYCSYEPCVMCSLMIREYQFRRVVFAIPSSVVGGYTRFPVLQDTNLEILYRYYSSPPEIVCGLLKEKAMRVWLKREKSRTKGLLK